LFDEGKGFDEEELDIEKASEQSLLAPLVLQAYLAFVMHLHVNAKKDFFVEKRNKIYFLLMCKLACTLKTRETNLF